MNLCATLAPYPWKEEEWSMCAHVYKLPWLSSLNKDNVVIYLNCSIKDTADFLYVALARVHLYYPSPLRRMSYVKRAMIMIFVVQGVWVMFPFTSNMYLPGMNLNLLLHTSRVDSLYVPHVNKTPLFSWRARICCWGLLTPNALVEADMLCSAKTQL